MRTTRDEHEQGQAQRARIREILAPYFVDQDVHPYSPMYAPIKRAKSMQEKYNMLVAQQLKHDP